MELRTEFLTQAVGAEREQMAAVSSESQAVRE